MKANRCCPECRSDITVGNRFLVCMKCDWLEERNPGEHLGESSVGPRASITIGVALGTLAYLLVKYWDRLTFLVG